MERGKVGRSYGEGWPKGETWGETGRPRAQSVRGRSGLLTASSGKVAALPANESIALVWTRVPGWAPHNVRAVGDSPTHAGNWKARSHLARC